MIRLVTGALLALLAIAASPGAVSGAEFGIAPGSLAIQMLDAEGNPDDRAGAHPDQMRIEFELNREGTGTSPRDFLFELPPGFANTANAVPRCPREVFSQIDQECPADTQVGLLTQTFGGVLEVELPIFSIEPAPTEAATLGTRALWNIPMNAQVRPDDFGVTLAVRDLAQAPLGSSVVELWGVPADHQEGTSIPRRPFVAMPTRCGSLQVTFRTRSWQVGAPWLSQTAETEAPLSECKDLSFAPKLGFALSNPASDSPSGAQIELTMPADEDPDGRASSQMRSMNVDLPEGLGLAPGGAEGLSTCSDGQFALGESTRASCPPSSKVGSVELETPELLRPLTGDLYIGEERPGERFRVFISVNGPGVIIKLAGTLHADPATGRLSVVMNDMPQVPITRVTMNLDDGPQALLATPLNCGSATVAGRFAPYGGGDVVGSSASTQILSGPSGRCPDSLPFKPTLVAGSSNPVAGLPTSFSMTMVREDGEQMPERLSVKLPAGLSAALGAVELCSNASASSGTCPDDSKIGSAFAELGSGPSPAVLQGSAYLTEPYHRAPFGLVVVFPARVGPFDLGNFVVRGKLRLDSRTAQVTIETDPIPQIFEGVPARTRTIGIDIDRRGFIRNPTSCEPTSVDATIQATGGASSTASSPFSLLGCERLGFKPRFSLRMVDRSQLHKRGRPGLSMSIGFHRGSTNLRMMKVTFPGVLKLGISGLREICSRRDARAGLCGKGSRVGTVRADTPLLKEPLRGGVFIVQPKGNGSPEIWLHLAGTGIEVNVRGRSSREDGHSAIKFVDLPDMPLSTLDMRLPGGRTSTLSLSAGLCVHGHARRLISPVVAEGQDGAYREMRIPLRVEASCE